MADLEAIAENLSELTVMEAANLVKMLEEKWGVSAAAPVAVGMMAAPGAAAEEAAGLHVLPLAFRDLRQRQLLELREGDPGPDGGEDGVGDRGRELQRAALRGGEPPRNRERSAGGGRTGSSCPRTPAPSNRCSRVRP